MSGRLAELSPPKAGGAVLTAVAHTCFPRRWPHRPLRNGGEYPNKRAKLLPLVVNNQIPAKFHG